MISLWDKYSAIYAGQTKCHRFILSWKLFFISLCHPRFLSRWPLTNVYMDQTRQSILNMCYFFQIDTMCIWFQSILDIPFHANEFICTYGVRCECFDLDSVSFSHLHYKHNRNTCCCCVCVHAKSIWIIYVCFYVSCLWWCLWFFRKFGSHFLWTTSSNWMQFIVKRMH